MNGEGGLYQRKSDGRWVGAVTLGWENGRQVRKIVTGKTAAETRAKLDSLRDTIAKGMALPDNKSTVGRVLDDWYDILRRQVAATAFDNYSVIADTHIRPTLGARPVAKLTVAEVDRLLNAKLADGLSVSTVRRIRAVLAQALKQAERWGLVSRNVAALSTPPKSPRREGRALSEDEARTLLEALRGHRHEALFMLMLAVGLRRGEALGLRWSDVDLDGATLRVVHQLKREGDSEGSSRLVLGDVKTVKSRRAVALPAFMVEELIAHRSRQEAERAEAGDAWHDTGHVFTTRIGTPLDPRNVYREFVRIVEGAGLGRWHPHELRHSAATLMLAAGVPIEVVSNVLGHSSIRMTADTYGHLGATHRVAADAMSAALGR